MARRKNGREEGPVKMRLRGPPKNWAQKLVFLVEESEGTKSHRHTRTFKRNSNVYQVTRTFVTFHVDPFKSLFFLTGTFQQVNTRPRHCLCCYLFSLLLFALFFSLGFHVHFCTIFVRVKNFYVSGFFRCSESRSC